MRVTPIERKILEAARNAETSALDIIDQHPTLSLGAVHVSASRLEDRGLIRTRLVPEGPERGGHSKLLIIITPEGEKALEAPCE